MSAVKNSLAISYAKLAIFTRDHQDDHDTAQRHFLAARQIWQELTAQAPNYAEFQRNLQQVNKDLAALDNS